MFCLILGSLWSQDRTTASPPSEDQSQRDMKRIFLMFLNKNEIKTNRNNSGMVQCYHTGKRQ